MVVKHGPQEGTCVPGMTFW